MKLLTRLFTPLRRAAVAFFRHDLALRRAGGGLRIVLEERAAARGDKPSREDLQQRKESEELALMRCQLAELLAGVPEARNALRHLVFVEQALARKGLKALHKLPLGVLQRGLTQLESLVLNWSPEGLANLRSKMAVAIIDREHIDPEAEADAHRTAAVLDTSPPPPESLLPEVSFGNADDEALAAAYAALGNLAPTGAEGGLEMTGELGSPSAKAALRDAARPEAQAGEAATAIKLRELQP